MCSWSCAAHLQHLDPGSPEHCPSQITHLLLLYTHINPLPLCRRLISSLRLQSEFEFYLNDITLTAPVSEGRQSFQQTRQRPQTPLLNFINYTMTHSFPHLLHPHQSHSLTLSHPLRPSGSNLEGREVSEFTCRQLDSETVS